MLVIVASPAEAGFLSSIFNFFSGGGDIKEVSASQDSSRGSLFPPILGSVMPEGSMAGSTSNEEESQLPLAVTQDSALIALQNPAGTFPSENQHGNIILYTVQKGDTPSAIAKKYGITLNTLLWANEIKNSSSIKIGDELIILPVSGVQYTVKKGDTIGSIAKKFKGDSADIMAFNGLSVNETLQVGMDIIIPDGELSFPAVTPSTKPTQPSRFASLPAYVGYYARPIAGGRRTQGIHGYNGVDIADSCGTPVFASATGAVIIARSTGWNSGYGEYVAISHANGTQTLYAHLSRLFVSPGENVTQGAVIGLIGSTGRSTGCHVHFEVRGAKNPF